MSFFLLSVAYPSKGKWIELQPKRPEKLMDQIIKEVKTLFDDTSLSWEAVYMALDALEAQVCLETDSISLEVAYVIHKKGVVQFNLGLQGNKPSYQTALQLYQQAVDIRQHFVKSHPEVSVEIINGLNNISGCLLRLRRPYEAQLRLHKALELINKEALNSSIIILKLKLNIYAARTYAEIGDFDKALLHYENMLSLTSIDSLASPQTQLYQLIAYIESGGIKVNHLNRATEGLDDLHKAEKHFADDRMYIKASIRADCYNNLGIGFKESGDYPKAYQYYAKSIRINSLGDRKFYLAGNYLNLGVLHMRMNELDSAEHYLLKAGDIYDELDLKNDWAIIHDNLGDIYAKRHGYEEAIRHYNQALTFLIDGYQNQSLTSHPIISGSIIADKSGMLVTMGSRAKAFVSLYENVRDTAYLYHALKTFRLCDELIESLRKEFISDGSKLTLAEYAKPVYAEAINVCWLLFQLKKEREFIELAFHFSEKSRSLVLYDAVRIAKASFNIPKHLLNRERALNQKALYLEKQLFVNQEHSHLKDSLLDCQRRLIDIRQTINTEFGNYHDLIYGTEPISLTAMASSLKKEQTFMEYFLSEEHLFTFLANHDTTVFVKLKNPRTCREKSLQIIEAIERQDNRFIQPSHVLFELLLGPFHSFGNLLRSHLIIVPDGILGSISFEALITKPQSLERINLLAFKDYLLFNHHISYAFSGSLMDLKANGSDITRSILAVAPEFSAHFYQDQTFFNPLFQNKQEIQSIGRHFEHAKIISGSTSTEEFKNQAGSYDLIHLATHGKANSEHGDYSFILFGEEESEKFYAKDLYGLKLDANLVVLSACQTASGTMKRGEGVISLARGFMYAGASAIITSLWNVREEINTQIILEFYDHLLRGERKSKALQLAKLSYLDQVTRKNQNLIHPYYWSSLIITGDDRGLRFSSKNSRKWLVYFLLFGLILFGIRWFIARKN